MDVGELFLRVLREEEGFNGFDLGALDEQRLVLDQGKDGIYPRLPDAVFERLSKADSLQFREARRAGRNVHAGIPCGLRG